MVHHAWQLQLITLHHPISCSVSNEFIDAKANLMTCRFRQILYSAKLKICYLLVKKYYSILVFQFVQWSFKLMFVLSIKELKYLDLINKTRYFQDLGSQLFLFCLVKTWRQKYNRLWIILFPFRKLKTNCRGKGFRWK